MFLGVDKVRKDLVESSTLQKLSLLRNSRKHSAIGLLMHTKAKALVNALIN